MRTVATIEARMGSSRLPGKVLLPAAGIPLLGHLVARLQEVPNVDEIVLATTTDPRDNVLEEWAQNNAIQVYRGSTDDVMGRVIEAAKSVDADVVVEITGDCPLIDPYIVELAIETFAANSADFVSNAVVRSYPDGMDVQVFRLETLERSYNETCHPLDLEHVTRHIRLNPDKFRHLHMIAPIELRRPDLGLTLDEFGDYELIRSVIEFFADKSARYRCGEILEYLDEHPDILGLNELVQRKGLV